MEDDAVGTVKPAASSNEASQNRFQTHIASSPALLASDKAGPCLKESSTQESN